MTDISDPDAALASPPPTRLRIIHINDVYELDNLPTVRTAIDDLSKGLPRSNVLTTLAGDFLAPSLLSSIDHGHSMVAVMNALPIDAVCFGNHECDVPFNAMLQRIEEFGGVWLNTNMRSLSEEEEMLDANACPHHHLRVLAPAAEGEPERSVVLVGLLQGGGKDAALYRDGAFDGHAARITPVLEAAPVAVARARAACPRADCVIPLTHQDLRDDVALASMGLGFPCILGGHDHGVIAQDVAGVPVLKAGEDAHNLIVVDLEWAHGAAPSPSPPTSVRHRIVALAPPKKAPPPGTPLPPLAYAPHAPTASLVSRLQQPAVQLQTSVLAQYEPGALSSVGTRLGPSTMATLVATAMRDVVKADVGLVHAGAVRGNRRYEDGVLTFGDLQAECPFPSTCVVALIDGATLRDAVQRSRRTWVPAGGDAGGAASVAAPLAIHLDDRVEIDGATWAITAVRGAPLEPGRLYRVLLDSYLLKEDLFRPYCEAHPERIPPDDSGRPALPMLVEYYCARVWRALVDGPGGVEQLFTAVAAAAGADEAAADADIDAEATTGRIDLAGLSAAIEARLGPRFASRVVAQQCLTFVDRDGDGAVSKAEVRQFMIEQGLLTKGFKRRSVHGGANGGGGAGSPTTPTDARRPGLDRGMMSMLRVLP